MQFPDRLGNGWKYFNPWNVLVYTACHVSHRTRRGKMSESRAGVLVRALFCYTVHSELLAFGVRLISMQRIRDYYTFLLLHSKWAAVTEARQIQLTHSRYTGKRVWKGERSLAIREKLNLSFKTTMAQHFPATIGVGWNDKKHIICLVITLEYRTKYNNSTTTTTISISLMVLS